MMLIENPARIRKTYPQEWHEYNQAQTNEKARFLELLFELCKGIEEPVQTCGRPRLLFSDMIFCAAFKVYSAVSGRRFISDLREAQQRGLISKTPHFNSVSNYLEAEELTPYLKQLIAESSLPLKAVECDFAVDSSGFSTSQHTRWTWAKYGKNPTLRDRGEWVKVHLMCGVKTNVVTSVEVTDRTGGDSPQFKPLVDATARNFRMSEVSADKAYLSTANLRLVTEKRGMPYIPFKSNSTATPTRGKQDPMWKWFFHLYMANQGAYMEKYHKRSNVETTFSMIKAKFGERLRSKGRTAQINEVLCKVLCHNICCLIQSIYELGIEPTFWTE